jgi:seryl-tRNA synthetase
VLDLRHIRENATAVAENARNRGVEVNVDLVVELADRRSKLIQELNELRQQQNQLAKSVGRERDPEARESLIVESRRTKELIPEREADLQAVEGRLREEMLQIPNMTHPEVPIGRDDTENVELRRVGKIPDFGFEPKDHVELGEALGIIDFEAGTKVAGSKFYFLRRDAVLLELGLVRYALDRLIEHGYEPAITPDLARDEALIGTGFMPRGPETQIYSVENSDLSLIATAEISLASRGLYRVHQFTKVEMFAFAQPEQSEALHEEMLGIEEEIFGGLGIPYRVVDICTGDLGGAAYRKYDLEAWMPGRGAYGEITSTSNTTDYQARRLQIRYRTDGGRPQLLHTLNGTAIAVSRALIPILENNQQEDGTVLVPEALVPYVGKKVLEPAG